MTIPMTPTDLDRMVGSSDTLQSQSGMFAGSASGNPDLDAELMTEAMTIDPTKGKAPKSAGESADAKAAEAKETKSSQSAKSEKSTKSSKSSKSIKSAPDFDMLADINIMQL